MHPMLHRMSAWKLNFSCRHEILAPAKVWQVTAKTGKNLIESNRATARTRCCNFPVQGSVFSHSV
jgi:hypothetical protein